MGGDPDVPTIVIVDSLPAIVTGFNEVILADVTRAMDNMMYLDDLLELYGYNPQETHPWFSPKDILAATEEIQRITEELLQLVLLVVPEPLSEEKKDKIRIDQIVKELEYYGRLVMSLYTGHGICPLFADVPG